MRWGSLSRPLLCSVAALCVRSLCASVARVAPSSRRSVPPRYSRSAAFRGSSPVPAGFALPSVGRSVCPVGGGESGPAVGGGLFVRALARGMRVQAVLPTLRIKEKIGLLLFPPSLWLRVPRPLVGRCLADLRQPHRTDCHNNQLTRRRTATFSYVRSRAAASTNGAQLPLSRLSEKVNSYS